MKKKKILIKLSCEEDVKKAKPTCGSAMCAPGVSGIDKKSGSVFHIEIFKIGIMLFHHLRITNISLTSM